MPFLRRRSLMSVVKPVSVILPYRVGQLSKNEYYFLKIKDIELLDATPYSRQKSADKDYYLAFSKNRCLTHSHFRKQPTILLRYNNGSTNPYLSILDTSTFSKFIMAMDNDVSFLDCNHWLSLAIDGEIDFTDLVKSFLEDYSDRTIGVWVKAGIIHGIDDGAFDTQSKYIIELYQQLPVYLFGKDNTWSSGLKMSRFGGKGNKRYPTLVYHDGKKSIEIVCATQRTKVVGRYEVGEGSIQPTTVSSLPFWAHLVPIETLKNEVQKHLDALDSIEEKKLPKQTFTKGRANSLVFGDRNRLEYEDYLLIFNK